ncbi:MAG: serine hydrolase domain-containing protein [Alphaproteobacteria bacterium]
MHRLPAPVSAVPLVILLLLAPIVPPAAAASAGPEPTASLVSAPAGVERPLPAVVTDAGALAPLRTVIVARRGEILAERAFRGASVTAPANIKSASKSIISALVGIAIDRGVLDGPEQRVAPLLRGDLPPDPDPRLEHITVGHLLSMQAGLERTSGANYGRWVSSRNWVRAALAQPFVAEPGGPMLYSTGSTHLLSAILTRATGRSTLELARDWLAPLPGFAIAAWERDPQGIYLGGNQMALSPRALLAFGELYRNGGRTPDGRQVVSEDWIERSWQYRTRSRFTGDAYGYGWFARRIAGRDVHYAWGYGGQMLYIVPSLDLTVAMTSDDTDPAGRSGHRDDLHRLLADIMATVTAADAEGVKSSPARTA